MCLDLKGSYKLAIASQLKDCEADGIPVAGFDAALESAEELDELVTLYNDLMAQLNLDAVIADDISGAISSLSGDDLLSWAD